MIPPPSGGVNDRFRHLDPEVEETKTAGGAAAPPAGFLRVRPQRSTTARPVAPSLPSRAEIR